MKTTTNKENQAQHRNKVTHVDDKLQFNMVINVINTDRIPPPEAAELIADGTRRYSQGANVKQLSISQTR